MRMFGFALTVAVLCLLAKNLLGAEKPITLDVQPQVAIARPYNTTTFRVRIQIPKHKDNRLLSYSASCGQEIKSSEYQIDHITYQWYDDFTVSDDCIFQACVHRIVGGKIKNFCDYQVVTVGDEPSSF